MTDDGKTDEKTLANYQSLDEVLSKTHVSTHPVLVRKEAQKEIKDLNGEGLEITPEKALYKALTMEEFNEGMLLSSGFSEHMRTFCVDLSLKLQRDYHAESSGERATAHLASQSYSRILELQRKINAYLSLGTMSELGVKYLAVLSKELDRAQRHYYNAIQTLQAMKQPPLNLTVKAQQANFAQNMAVQKKEEYGTK